MQIVELHATVPDYKFPHRRQKFMTFIMAWICDRYHSRWISSLLLRELTGNHQLKFFQAFRTHTLDTGGVGNILIFENLRCDTNYSYRPLVNPIHQPQKYSNEKIFLLEKSKQKLSNKIEFLIRSTRSCKRAT